VSIRSRLALVFTVAVAVVFSLGAWLFVAALSSGLLSSIDSQLSTELSLASRYVGHSATASGAGSPAPLPGEYLVQVLDASGRVRGASADAGSTPFIGPAERRRAATAQVVVTVSTEGERTRVAAAPFASRAGWVAVAAVSLETYDRTMRDVFSELLVAGIVFVLAAGIGAYGLARAALSPVERMRREVAAQSERDDEAGVEVPGTHDELAALAITMNQLLSRLHRALARQRAFVADASHELRTPFAVLRGELELAGRPGRTRDELALAVANAAEEAARLNRLTDDLLLLARSDSDRLALRTEVTDLAPILERSVEFARARADAAGVRLGLDVPRPMVARIDGDRVRQAVDDLLDNALRFAPRDTEVVLRCRAADDDLTIEVLDAGPGFPPDFLPHAFERFARPDRGRARGDGGAGLGLAIVNAIALAHGGRALARNRDEGGAAVSLDLPGAIVSDDSGRRSPG